MHGFESLGDNCEFGLVQRRCGAEPLGLLRFANLELRQLLISLNPGSMASVNRPAWSAGCRTARSANTSFATVGMLWCCIPSFTKARSGQEELIEKQAKRLRFLRRKLLDDLKNADKIFVCKRNAPLTEQEVLPLHAALNRFGRNTLLWVVSADAEHPAGAVDRLVPGLLRGYIDRFAPYEDAHDLSLATWLSICVNGSKLARGSVPHQ